MTTFTTYRLHFTSPVHFGDNREDYGISLRYIHSDTFHAALTACLAKTGTEIPSNGDLGFCCSSLFPFYQQDMHDAPVYFFPKPLGMQQPVLKDLSKAKKVKKVQWIDTSYLNRILWGEPLIQDDQDIQNIQSGFLSQRTLSVDESGKQNKNSQVGNSVQEDSFFMQAQISPRVKVSRSGEKDATPFYMERLSFKGTSGLFLLAKGDTRLLEQGLAILSQEGIGTDRNVGNGYFEYEKGTMEIDIPKTGSHTLCLSTFIPESQEQLKEMLSGKNIAYDFARRGGWITDADHIGLRKNFIHVFLPGSVFKSATTQGDILGKIVDLRPDLSSIKHVPIPHPIWRNGRALFLPINL